MSRFALLFAGLLVFCSCDVQRQSASEHAPPKTGGSRGAAVKGGTGEDASLQGAWCVVRTFGRPPGDIKAYWTFRDGKVTVAVGEDRETASESPYSVDPNQTPKHITMEIRDIAAETRLGIYEVDGTTLRLSFTVGGGPRPTGWSKEDTIVLKRIDE